MMSSFITFVVDSVLCDIIFRQKKIAKAAREELLANTIHFFRGNTEKFEGP